MECDGDERFVNVSCSINHNSKLKLKAAMKMKKLEETKMIVNCDAILLKNNC